MGKEYGKIRKGEEEVHSMMLFPMESNVLKIHRTYPGPNSRRLREAIGLVLFDIKSRVSGEEADTGVFGKQITGGWKKHYGWRLTHLQMKRSGKF